MATMRAKTYDPATGKGGGRQAMWNALRRGRRTAGELVTISASADGSVRSYMAVLIANGYVESPEPGTYALLRNTGKRAPSVNNEAGTVYDWNLNPPMARAALKAVWQKSGLSLNAFGLALGLSVNSGTRLKQMIDGSRTISPTVEAAALAYRPAKR